MKTKTPKTKKLVTEIREAIKEKMKARWAKAHAGKTKKETKSTSKSTIKKAPPEPKEPGRPRPSADAGTPATREIPYVRDEKVPLASILMVYNARTGPLDDDELRDSIQQYGFLTDLWLYRLKKPGKNGEEYGLIAGHRRVHNGKKTTHLVAPGRIYDGSEAEVLALGLIDNIQRKQLSAIEEAFAYKKMIDELKWKAWDEANPEKSLGHRLGKSKTNIFSLLKLTELPKLGVDAVRSGELSPSVGIRIARIPNEKNRLAAVKEAIQCEWTDNLAAEAIERHYMTELKGAPFDRKDETLNPERGSCDKCPLRSGNQAELFPDMAKGRADICTDPSCYRLKCERAFSQRAEKHRAAGGNVLSREQAKKAGLYDNYSSVGGEYTELDRSAYELRQGSKTYRQLLAPALKDGRLAPTLAMANDGSGKHFEIFKVADIKRVAKDLGIKAEERSSGGSCDADREHRIIGERSRAELRHILALIYDAGATFLPIVATETAEPLLRGSVRWLIDNLSADARRVVTARHELDKKTFQLEPEKAGAYVPPNAWMDTALVRLMEDAIKAGPRHLVSLQMELMAVPDYPPGYGSIARRTRVVLDMLGIDSTAALLHARWARKAAERQKVDGVTPAEDSCTWCDWTSLDDYNKRIVRKRWKGREDSEHAKYKYAFALQGSKTIGEKLAGSKILARYPLEVPPALQPLLWEQLDEKQRAKAKKKFPYHLDKRASFLFDGEEVLQLGICDDEPDDDEDEDDEPEESREAAAEANEELAEAQI